MKKIKYELRQSKGCVQIIIIVIILECLISCQKSFKKPWMITSKKPEDKLVQYHYRNTSGQIGIFWETYDKYQIGDTIK